MANLKDMAASRGTLMNFDPRELRVKDGLNARDLSTADNKEHIEWLAESIATDGVKTPLVVFLDGGHAYVSDGHCRLAATMLAIERGADIKTVPCIPEGRGVNDVDRVLSQNIYNSGKQLTPIEQGVNFKKALALGATVAQIAQRVGKSAGYVSQMIDFQGAPEEAHNLVKQGAVSATFAAKTIKKDGNEAGLEKIKKAVSVAKAAGKSRATAKHAAPEVDPVWRKLSDFVRLNPVRPESVTDEAVIAALDALCID